MSEMDLYHGGFPGLNVGDWIEAPEVTGARNTLSAFTASDSGHGTRTDVVYVTSARDAARAFAAFFPNGGLYRVEAQEVVGPDPDAPTLALMCRRARVLEVVRANVIFEHRRPESWLRLLTRANR